MKCMYSSRSAEMGTQRTMNKQKPASPGDDGAIPGKVIASLVSLRLEPQPPGPKQHPAAITKTLSKVDELIEFQPFQRAKIAIAME